MSAKRGEAFDKVIAFYIPVLTQRAHTKMPYTPINIVHFIFDFFLFEEGA